MKTKKTFKAVIAMTLALILSLGTMTAAFAANKGDITWTADGETATCTYLSDLAVGTNTVEVEENGYYYFDLSELENGYYSVEITDSIFDYFALPEKSGNGYNGWGDGENYFGSDADRVIFRRSENVDVAVAGAYGAAEAVKIDVEFLGEDIETLEVSDENFDELLLHYDIIEYYTNEYGTGVYIPSDSADIKVESTSYGVSLDTTVTFTGGKTIEEEGTRYWFDVEGDLKKGENTVTLNFAGYEFEQVLNVAYISDYISGVEVKESGNEKAYIYYNYDYDLVGDNVNEITIVFTDNTKQTVESGKVILPNGREIEIECMYGVDIDNLTVRLIVGAGAKQIAIVDLDTEKASLSDNVSRLGENISWFFRRIENRFEQASLLMKAGLVQEAMTQLGYAFSGIGNGIEGIVNQIGLFINFMFR